jgi:hypothetical protein
MLKLVYTDEWEGNIALPIQSYLSHILYSLTDQQIKSLKVPPGHFAALMDSGTHFEMLYGCFLHLPILNNCLNGQVLELRQTTNKGQHVLAVVK